MGKTAIMARWPTALAVGWLCFAAPPVFAADPTDLDCFDAKVLATLISQTPTAMPDCGEGCIVMRWPWFLEYKVDRVLEGPVARGSLTVLSVQHTYYRDDLGPQRLFLRRNDVGGFNLVHAPESGKFARCPPSTPPARAYIKPGPEMTLEDLRREGEAYYGKHPQ